MDSHGSGLEQVVHTHRTLNCTGVVGREGLVHQMPVLTPEYLLPSQWVADVALTYSLPALPSKYLLTMHHQSVAQNLSNMWCYTFEIGTAQPPYQKSPQNCRSYAWTEALSGMVLVSCGRMSYPVKWGPIRIKFRRVTWLWNCRT